MEFLLSKSANSEHLSVPRHVLLITVPTNDIEKTSSSDSENTRRERFEIAGTRVCLMQVLLQLTLAQLLHVSQAHVSFCWHFRFIVSDRKTVVDLQREV